MIDSARLHPLLADRLSIIDWDMRKQFILLGDLASIVHVLPDFPSKSSLMKLGSITARLREGSKTNPPSSLHVYLSLSVSDSATETDISGSELAEFYGHFFKSGVDAKHLKRFFGQHATVMVVRHVYYKSDCYRLEIVGALSFSRPTDSVPTYLAFLAVSNGCNEKLPCLSDTKHHVIPPSTFSSGDCPVGYRGLGLGSFLIFFMEHLVISSIRKGTESVSRRLPFPECFLHFNANNEESGDGWMKKGFVHVFGPGAPDDCEVALVRGRYAGLALSLLSFFIFKASHHDRVNCTSMYTIFGFVVEDYSSSPPPSHQNDPLSWYSDYSSSLDVRYVANHPSTPAYLLDVAEIKAKYSSKSTDPSSAAFWSIIQLAYSRKQYCLGRSSPHDQQKSVASPDDASVSSSDDDSNNDDTVSLKNKVSQKRKRLGNNKQSIHSIFSDQEFIDYACVQDPTRFLKVDPTSLVMNGSEKLLEVHVSSYLLPETMTLESVEFNQKRLKRSSSVVQCNWGWLQRVVVPEVAVILEEQIMGLSVVDGIGLDHADPSVAQRDVQTMVSFHGVHSRVAGFVSPPASHKQVSIPMNGFSNFKSTSGSIQRMIQHPVQCRNYAKNVKLLKIKNPPPPLPRCRYQISRLKWIPTDDPNACEQDKVDVGYFQGAYRLPGTSYFSLVSLRDEWVDFQFEPAFVASVKEQGLGGLNNAGELIPVPPGDAKNHVLPSPQLVHFMRASKYQQRGSSTCLIDAFCSAMHEFGCVRLVEELRANPLSNQVSAANKNIWGDFVRLVNLQFSSVGLRVCKQKGSKSVHELLQQNGQFVILVSLKASDASDGQHAVAIFNGGIFDANYKHVLKKTQKSLDWCCGGDGVTCTGVQRSFIVLPLGYHKLPINSRHVLQARNKTDYLVRGWVCSSNRVGSPLLQFADGVKRESTLEEQAEIYN